MIGDGDVGSGGLDWEGVIVELNQETKHHERANQNRKSSIEEDGEGKDNRSEIANDESMNEKDDGEDMKKCKLTKGGTHESWSSDTISRILRKEKLGRMRERRRVCYEYESHIKAYCTLCF